MDSPKASVSQTVGVTDVSISYHRPGVKGRKVWGEWPVETKGEATLDNSSQRPEGAPLVPNGHIWRTGANDATTFTATDDVLINGQPLAAGTYSLHTVPGKDEWSIIFNSAPAQWGSFRHDPSKDVLRVKANPASVAENQEWLAFRMDPASASSITVTIAWEKLRVPFTVSVKDVVATTLAKARVSVDGAKADDWQTPNQAATYAKANGAEADAAKWFEKALKVVDAQIASKADFQNLARKAAILRSAGKKSEELAAAEKAVEAGKKENANTADLEKRIAELKSDQ